MLLQKKHNEIVDRKQVGPGLWADHEINTRVLEILTHDGIGSSACRYRKNGQCYNVRGYRGAEEYRRSEEKLILLTDVERQVIRIRSSCHHQR